MFWHAAVLNTNLVTVIDIPSCDAAFSGVDILNAAATLKSLAGRFFGDRRRRKQMLWLEVRCLTAAAVKCHFITSQSAGRVGGAAVRGGAERSRTPPPGRREP